MVTDKYRTVKVFKVDLSLVNNLMEFFDGVFVKFKDFVGNDTITVDVRILGSRAEEK